MAKKETIFAQFTKQYKLSKTLRFELKPMGATLANMKKSGVLNHDFDRGEAYQAVKDVLDEHHKKLIEDATRDFDATFKKAYDAMSAAQKNEFAPILNAKKLVDWEILGQAYETFRQSGKTKEDRDALEKTNALYRKAIVKVLEADEMHAMLTEATPSKFFKWYLENHPNADDAPTQAVRRFSAFACYFTGFQENRANIYSPEKQATAAANRLVNDNFPKFLECRRIFAHIAERYPDVARDAEKKLAPALHGRKLAEVFALAGYAKVLSQTGIDDLNAIIGGYVPSPGKKLQGINEFINRKRQQDAAAKSDRALGRLPQLHKQILSDRESASFAVKPFTNDTEALAAVKNFAATLDAQKTLERLQAVLKTVRASDKIYLDAGRLPEVSLAMGLKWSALGDALARVAEAKFAAIGAAAKREREIDKWLNRRDEYPLSDFAGAVVLNEQEEETPVDVAAVWQGETAERRFKAVGEKFAAAAKALNPQEPNGLRERAEDVAAIKDYLDAAQDVLHFAKPLRVSADLDRDGDFYGDFDAIYEELDAIVPLYNRVRNYVTQKPSETKKMKLMFDLPKMGEGWDVNKEYERKATLLRKNDEYYLLVFAKEAQYREAAAKMSTKTTGDVWEKMVYKQIPNARNYFSIKQIKPQNPPQSILDFFQKGTDKKAMPKSSLTNAIKYVIEDFIPKYDKLHDDEGRCYFDFQFKKPAEYESWNDFCDDVARQTYAIRFEKVSAAAIDELVADGKAYLFKLWNKDFSPHSTGNKNLHTLYWNAVFSPDNLRDPAIKLQGGAELFYRPMAIEKPYRHKVGEKMVNRYYQDDSDSTLKPIPEATFGELFKYANGKLKREALGEEAKKLLNANKVIFKEVTHEIVKDARYAKNKFFFHCPIQLNANAADKPGKFNDKVNAAIKGRDDVNVIGIDRGERNLIYVTVIDREGKILDQRSFNVMEHGTVPGKTLKFDYQAKLRQAEAFRDQARKSWMAIGKIKDLKSGYLSLVVHEIAKLMLQYHAVVALEDLNFGFKRGRFPVERQVYQKFEKALIDKLNYLAFKDAPFAAPGGLLNGLQLTDKFESFEKLGKQSGFLYYVPAAYTSKIDPTTGFTNLFDMKGLTNAESVKKFFEKFSAIVYREAERAFEFAFDYQKFKQRLYGTKTQWRVFSAGRRLTFSRTENKEVELNPTAEILALLQGEGIEVKDCFDLLRLIRERAATRDNAKFFRTLLYAFDRTLQMRNSSAATREDYIASPVKNATGQFFDSRQSGKGLPQDADANGAYHIALKGLWMLTAGLEKGDLKLDNETWLAYAQSRG